MTTVIDSPGAYRGKITEAGLGTTKKGYPQWVVKLFAEEKYVEDKAELDHFKGEGVIGKAEPQWVDWSAFDEEVTGYLVMFNDPDSFDEDSKLLSYDNIVNAVGWDGIEFADLNNDKYVGEKVLFRLEENEYDGKTRLQVNWLDQYDASPTRELRKLDDDKVKDLASKMKMKGKKAKPAAAKPSKPGKAAPKTPPKKEEPAEEQQSFADSVEEETPEAKEDSAAKEADAPDLPSKVSMDKAWDYVCDNVPDGKNDTDVETAWLNAIEAIGDDEDKFSDEDWAKVRDAAMSALKA